MKLAGFGSFAAPRGQGGMTLVEMLVVVAIIAVVASAAAISLGSGRGLNGQAEAARLKVRLQMAADQTMITDSALALRVQPDGYDFIAWDAARGEWKAETDPVLGKRHDLPSGMTLRSDGAARGPLPLGADSSGQAFVLTLSDDDRSWRIEFDGMTARLAADRTAPAAGTGL